MKKLILILTILLFLPAAAQTTPDKLLVLIIGPSGDKIAPAEQGVVERLNQLRGEAGLTQLQMGTMHFDRPPEAEFCQRVLGVRKSDLVAVTLVQLDAQGQPQRALYTIPKVTPAAIDQAHQEILEQWSNISGVALPAAATRPDTHINRPPSQVYTPEGILNLARVVEQQTSAIWNDLRNQPMRSDGRDTAVRQTLLGLVESSRNLRVALEEGISNPKNRFEEVFAARDAWMVAEPQYYLPVDQRRHVEPLQSLFIQLEEAYTQLNQQGL